MLLWLLFVCLFYCLFLVVVVVVVVCLLGYLFIYFFIVTVIVIINNILAWLPNPVISVLNGSMNNLVHLERTITLVHDKN